ncbi:aminomethyl-transferring glycine dehydrogenase subunit GcvPB [Rhizobiales bacterium]|uniref:aminomethyl-transferring glycine dehydrogenase subunit GcvPB n=1 Tax=Hongsoonwoonella zoysiae TaxID=2821844 RepID=UPI00155F5A4B|nr:aminomethyl-transferring glycine dehydrogenase subunit GcvPB [Hongsoonwoonella zoysiae]NRG19776.1 aminomethyl-transferring glycine dehydrogenase subunit GcvPB [Hongsoonwoonella zoysiae]
MSMNTQGRPTSAGDAGEAAHKTFTGNKGLAMEEPLIFEIGHQNITGVDLDEPEDFEAELGGHARQERIDLPALTEPEAMRHYVRLSTKNYAIDSGLYPLGSCTMKHNPRLNEKAARMPGFADIHPLQPLSTVSGAVDLMDELSHWLMTMTGMSAVALSPKAGAHGELCGMMAIKAAHRANGRDPKVVLVPESAHGTNPATAALLGYKVVAVKARDDGTVDTDEVKAKIAENEGNVAGIMLTNPNTCGIFERDIIEIAEAIHAADAYFYCDGANFNAIVGKAKPGDLGVDAMHINLHKTFSTPHGGGGPGSGPVVLSDRLAPYAPLPFLRKGKDGVELVETTEGVAEGEMPFGRMTAFHGQMGMFVRALAYMKSHGSDGLKQASEDAVLNANYVRVGLEDLMSLPFGSRWCMHEVLFDDSFLKDTGVSTLDFAKAMIDEGYHPMTMYFPLVVHGAMLIEPTESESRASLDLFVATLRDLVMSAKKGETERFSGAPYLAPRRRLDETQAARKPVLKWERPSATEVQPAAAQ